MLLIIFLQNLKLKIKKLFCLYASRICQNIKFFIICDENLKVRSHVNNSHLHT